MRKALDAQRPEAWMIAGETPCSVTSVTAVAPPALIDCPATFSVAEVQFSPVLCHFC